LSIVDFQSVIDFEKIPGNVLIKLLNSSQYIRHFYTEEKQKIRLAVNTSFLSNQESIRIAEDISTKIDEFFQNKPPEYYITGASLLYADLNSNILDSQIMSLGGSFLIIFILITIIFQSKKISMTGILPNILPVINTLGIMGLLGIKLDVGTVLVASISLGMSVDDTIYLFHGYLRAIHSSNPISIALNKVAVTLFRTTIVICFGFLIMVFSNYQPVYFLGIFVAVNIFMALIYDLILVPWIVVKFKGVGNNYIK
jgi:predicted RND superfamily exporter protein